VIYDAQFELDKIAQEQATAQQNIQAARAYFNYLLQRDLNETVQIDTTLQNRLAATSLPDLKTQSASQRTELEQLRIATAANREQIERWEDKKLPNAYAVVDLGMQGTGYRPQDQAFAFGLVGVQWDIFTGFQNREREQQANIEEQILLQQQADLQQKIQLQIHQIYYQLQASRSTVAAAQSGIRNAKQRFNIINKRYKNQQANLLQLMDARTDLTTAEIQLAIAEFSVVLKEIELVWASGGY
ncbi:MAG: TolC family protein, partial [Saprospiraceae bacterium]